jgi:hypothetical protein
VYQLFFKQTIKHFTLLPCSFNTSHTSQKILKPHAHQTLLPIGTLKTKLPANTPGKKKSQNAILHPTHGLEPTYRIIVITNALQGKAKQVKNQVLPRPKCLE